MKKRFGNNKKMCPYRGEARCREINEVLDTCLSPVAHVCFCRSTVCNNASRHFSLKYSYFPLQLNSSFHLAFRPCVVFQSCRVSLQPPIRQYRILESDRPREIPTLEIYSSSSQDERLPIGLSDCNEIRFSVEIPELVNQRGIRAADIYFEQLVLIGAADSFDLSVYR